MIVTLSGPLGTPEAAWAAWLADRLDLRLFSRDGLRGELARGFELPSEEAPGEGGFRGWLARGRQSGTALAKALRELVGDQPALVVGWGGADIFAEVAEAFHLRLTAPRQDRLAAVSEWLDAEPETAARLLAESDQHRADFHRRFLGAGSDEPRVYHLVVNTSWLSQEVGGSLVVALAAGAGLTDQTVGDAGRGWRRMTVSREFGAGGLELAAALGQSLGWTVWDRELLQRSGALAGLDLPRLLRLDEHGPEFLERVKLMQDSARYFEALRDAVATAAADPAIVVGRGGNELLDPLQAFHLRLVADQDDRVERVMRRRWLSAPAAKELIDREHHARADFHRHFFDCDWADPTLYHAVCCSSRLSLGALCDGLTEFFGGHA